MKKLLTILFLFISYISFSQDIYGSRIIGRQAFYFVDRWLTGTKNDTTGLNGLTDKILTPNAIYDFVEGRMGAGGGGSGTVTSISIASANGFAGSSSGGATPILTLSTSVTGLLKGNGTAISAAVAGTDYLTPTGSAAGLTSFPTLNQNTTGSAATLTTVRNIQGIPFNGSANIDIINGTGFVKATGTTLSYDNSTYLTTVNAGYGLTQVNISTLSFSTTLRDSIIGLIIPDTSNLFVKRWTTNGSIRLWGDNNDTLMLKDILTENFLVGSTTTDSVYKIILDTAGTGFKDYINKYSAGGTASGFTSGSVLFTDTDGSITESNSVFFFDQVNSRVHLGGNDPEFRLHVSGIINLLAAFMNTAGSSPSTGGFIAVGNADGAALSDSARIGGLLWRGGTSTTAFNNALAIEGWAEGNWTPTSSPSRMEFQVTPESSLVRLTALSIASTREIKFDGYTTANFNGGTTTDSVAMIGSDGRLKKRDAALFTGTGEINTASNLGGGLANFDSKSGVDLRFNSFNGTDFDLGSNLISIDATLKSTWDAKQNAITLTTTGSSGAATFDGTTLNIPQYTAGGGGTGSNLSYDATNHEVDIDGGGTSAIIPLALDDGATEGLASFTPADFTVTAGNVAIDYANGQAATSGQDGFLQSADWTTFNNKGSGNVTKVGTPVDNQIGVWTGDGTIEGDADLVFNGTQLGIQGVPGYPLDIWNGGIGIVVGADNGASTRTNVTAKHARIGSAHYTNAEEPVTMMYTNNTSGGNLLYIGGGTGTMNAATDITFYTTTTITTVTGVEKLAIGGTATVFNETGANIDVRMEGDTDPNTFVLDGNGGGGAAGAIGIGIAVGSLNAKFNIRSTTEQQRTEYDASNYFSTTVSSTGSPTFDAVGTGPVFTFSDNVVLPLIKITGGVPGLGKVLTSDADGDATWETPGAGSGTVTSVGFTGGIISVATATTTPAFTVAGTSGGIPYFSSTSTWASSALLAANELMIGGGAGTAPSTTTTGTGILTFLGTPSSANLLAAVTDETGTGALVFANTPTLVTPVLGVATATSINKVTITAPTTSATLTLVTGSSLITVGAFATTLTSTATTNATLPAGTNTLYSTLSGSITSAQLATSLTNETGTAGFVVFSADPALTGVPTAPTAASGTNTTQIATTAFVLAAAQDAIDDNPLYFDAGDFAGAGTVGDPITIIGGGGAAWGGITGTLSDQTDLNTALGLKAPLISPSFTTPSLGVATATSINKVTITAPTTSATLTLIDGSSLITAGAFATTLTSTATTNATLPAGTNTLYSTLSGSITSAELLASLTNETGTGSVVFSATPTFTGVLTASSMKTAATGSASNFYIFNSDGAFIDQSTSQLLFGGGAGVTYRFVERGAFSTVLGVDDVYTSHIIGIQPFTEAASGTHALVSQFVVNPLLGTGGSATTTDAATVFVNGAMTGVTPTGRNDAFRVSGTSYLTGVLTFDGTITAGGTTGNQTINKPSGTVNIAAAGTTVTVTNSMVTTSSIVLAVIRTNDATARISNVVPAAGSFVINIVASTAEVSIGFVVLN